MPKLEATTLAVDVADSPQNVDSPHNSTVRSRPYKHVQMEMRFSFI